MIGKLDERRGTEIEVGREVAERTQYPAVRKLLGAFTEECPPCGRGRDGWEFDFSSGPPIREGGEYDLVAYVCSCGERFRKVEDRG